MKNADMPAMPMPMTMMGADAEHVANEPEFGLTKREYFAGLAMQGLTHGAFRYIEGHATEAAMVMVRDIGKVSCDIADALLAELDKEAT